MHTRYQLSPEQRTAFVRQGYLVVPGELSLGMISQLLQTLESVEGKNPREGAPRSEQE